MNRPLPQRSLLALNAANFFQGATAGVLLPVLGVVLREAHWDYASIGVATAACGLGTLLFQAAAGCLTDRFPHHRLGLILFSLLAALCLAAIPVEPLTWPWVDSSLFLYGALSAFFGPLLAALALGLAGYHSLSAVIGKNQGWNHSGNVAAALLAAALIPLSGLHSLFFLAAASALLTAAAALALRERDLNPRLATGLTPQAIRPVAWTRLLRPPRVRYALLSVTLFHLANAPILPLAALYAHSLGASDSLTTATVTTAQIVMVPVSLLASRLCDSWGRKPLLALAFWVLPLRILCYPFASTPYAVVALQLLDGIGAGIFGVAIIPFTADLTRGKGHFNGLLGCFNTAVALGGVAGPLLAGFLLQQLGFASAFHSFAALSLLAALLFTAKVPETLPIPSPGPSMPYSRVLPSGSRR
jgi:MFS family permease